MWKTKHTWQITLVALGLALGFHPQAQGETIYVDAATCPFPGTGTQADPFCSIQTAIEAVGINALGQCP